ncbi:Uncharacterized protein Rs2_21578 [Raphanus sativus]|nr:Uncharacterized protein Rs2_21578 [Raphanus sativus]
MSIDIGDITLIDIGDITLIDIGDITLIDALTRVHKGDVSGPIEFVSSLTLIRREETRVVFPLCAMAVPFVLLHIIRNGPIKGFVIDHIDSLPYDVIFNALFDPKGGDLRHVNSVLRLICAPAVNFTAGKVKDTYREMMLMGLLSGKTQILEYHPQTLKEYILVAISSASYIPAY